MKVLYGRVIETFDESQIPISAQTNFALKNYSQLQERDLIAQGRSIFSHYTNSARLMKVFDPARDCRPATEAERSEGQFRIVHGKVCAHAPKDHFAFGDFQSDMSPFGVAIPTWHAKDGAGRDHVRWNYRWGEQYGPVAYPHTNASDTGADIYEVTQNAARAFDLQYPWSYFRRNRREWLLFSRPNGAASYFERMRGYHAYVALDLSRAAADDLTSDDDARPYALALPGLLGALQKAILTPEPGGYTATKIPLTTGGFLFDVPDPASTSPAFTIDVADGRYLTDKFNNVKGGSWNYSEYADYAGFYQEKTLAAMSLLNPQATISTISRSNYLDRRRTDLGLRQDLSSAVDRLVGGILSEDWETLAPYVDDSGAMASVDLTQTTVTRPPSSRVVFPNLGYTQELGIATFAAVYSRLAQDLTFIEKLRVWKDGDAAPTVSAARRVRFVEPASGHVYYAASYGTEALAGKTVDRGIGSRMVGHANELAAKAYQVTLDVNGKPVLTNGEPTFVLDPQGLPVVVSPEDASSLRSYITLLEVARQLGHDLDAPLQ